MSIKKSLLKIAGKDNFEIDERIGNAYLIAECWRYGWMLIRGKVFSLGYSNISKTVFIGKGVKVRAKKRLSIGSKSKLHDRVYIDALSTENVSIGDNVVIGRDCRIECTGSIKTIGKGIIIGNRTSFGPDCFFGAAGGIVIGEDVLAGQSIRFHAENHRYDDIETLIKNQGVSHKGIRVGNDCWIGAGAVFLDGAEIGNGCVVAANAVVTRVFPDNCVIAGMPAKVIAKREVNHLGATI